MTGRGAFLDEAERALGIELPRSYRRAFLEKRVLTGLYRYELCMPAECYRLDREMPEWGLRGLVIGHDEGGDMLVLLFDDASPTKLADPVYALDHATRELRRIAPGLDRMFERRKLPSLAQLEREAGKPERPKKHPPSDTARALSDVLRALSPVEAGAVLSALRGDALDYARLVHTQGACSDAYAAWKLKLSLSTAREAAARALEDATAAGRAG